MGLNVLVFNQSAKNRNGTFTVTGKAYMELFIYGKLGNLVKTIELEARKEYKIREVLKVPDTCNIRDKNKTKGLSKKIVVYN